MAGNKCVIVLAPNGRRQTVKVTPNSTILQVLEEVCKKQGFVPKEYDIKHHNHVLDTTAIIRFSGLPNNAQLEMVTAQKIREETAVVLSLQLESGDRLLGSFLPTNSLWDVIEKLCPTEADPDSNPVVIYMRKEVFGKKGLEETTLRSLGLTGGRAMLRFIHRTPEELHHQANVSGLLPQRTIETFSTQSSFKYISSPEYTSDASHSDLNLGLETRTTDALRNPHFSESTTASVLQPSHLVTVLGNGNQGSCSSGQVLTTATSSSDAEEKMDIDSQDMNSSELSMETASENSQVPVTAAPEDTELNEEIIFLGERNAIAFSLEMAKAVPYEDLPDDFFELTLDDARACLRDLKKRRAETEESPFTTNAQRSLEKSKRVLSQLNQYRRAVIRVQFPDRTVLQGTFLPLETVALVMEFVRGYLANPQTDFYLYTTPPINILAREARLIDVECVPSAMVYFGTKDQVSSSIKTHLREDILNQFTSPSAATLAACQSRGIVPGIRPVSAPSHEKPNRSGKISHQLEDMRVSKENEQRTRTVNEGASTSSQRAVKREDGPSNKLPKWFKPVK